MQLLDTETATVNLFAGAAVLTHTVTESTALADLTLDIGDGDLADLAAAAETTLTIAITIDGVPLFGVDQTEVVATGRGWLRIPVPQFSVVAGEEIVVTLSSDQAGDTAVAVTATLRNAASTIVAAVTRTLAAEAASTSGNIIRKQATQWIITVEGLSELPAANAIYFTLKSSTADADAAALIQVRAPIDGVTGNIGLLTLNGENVHGTRAAQASITYESYVESEVTYYRAIVTVEAEATVEIDATSTMYVWDIKSVGTDDAELDSGQMRVTAGVTLTV